MARKDYDYLFKLLLIGDDGVGIDFRIKTIELMGKKIKLQIWDTAGQERFKTVTTAYYRGAMGLMLVYDITQEKSFRSIEKWMQNVKEHASEQTKIILVGNNCDLEDQRQVSTDRARELASSYGIKVMEVSAKENINIQEAFFTLATDILSGIETGARSQLASHKKSAHGAVLFETLGKTRSSNNLLSQPNMEKDVEFLRPSQQNNYFNRQYLMEGPVEFSRGMQTQDRYLFLFNDLLLVAKQKQIEEERSKLPPNTQPLDVHHTESDKVPKGVSSSKDLKGSAEAPGKEKNTFRNLLTSIFGGKRDIPLIPEEITEDPYALNLYETALRDGVEQDRSVRINIVGNFGQGKTSLVRRLLGKTIGDVESTDGIDVNHYRYHQSADGKVSLKKAQEKDTSDVVDRLVSVALSADQTLSQEQTSSITQSQNVSHSGKYVHNASVDFEHTKFKDLQLHFDEKDDRKGNSPKRNIIMTDTDAECQRGSKGKDIPDKNLKVAMFSEEEKAKFLNEVANKKSQSSSQKTQPSFYIWDFGGQYIFYATHTLFHSTHAVYLLVFDLSIQLGQVVIDKDFPGESNENTMEYFIQFWMNSIHSFVGSKNGSEPKVILVGTHKDKIKGTAEEKRKYIENYFSSIRSSFDGTAIINHFHKDDFAVDNTVANDKAIRELLQTVISTGNDQSRMLSIPAKWIPLEKALIERRHIKVISFELVLAIDSANEIPLGDTEQVKLFLRYHHSKGTLIYFDEKPISEYVILDPQYLIDAFKSIITSERFCTRDPVMRPLWKMLLTEARLEQRLIEEQWKRDEEQMFMEHKEILLAFLKKHHIISEATHFDEVTQQTVGLGWFVVPSLLKAEIPQSELHEFLTGKKQTVLRFVMKVDNSTVVPTVYHRLMAALIGKWPLTQYKSKTLISQNQCIVRLNIDHAGVAEMRHRTIELSVVNLCPSSDVECDQSDLLRRFTEEVVIHEFSKLHNNSEDRAVPYSRWYRCNHESHGVAGSSGIISADCFDERTSVPCPDLVSHEIQIKAKLEWTKDFRDKIIVNNPKLSDKILGRVSRCIGRNWQLLGLELGISQVQIEQITEDYPNSVVMRIYHMLKIWFCQMDDLADMNVLVQVLQHCDNVSIDWDEIRNITDEMK